MTATHAGDASTAQPGTSSRVWPRTVRNVAAPTAADYTRAQARAIRASKTSYQCGQGAAALIVGGAIGALAGTTALLITAGRWIMSN